MKLDKIKELITSPDRDLRLLGLSYLGDKKDSLELFVVPGKEVDLKAWEVVEEYPTSRVFLTFSEIYKFLMESAPIFSHIDLRPKSMLTIYIEYCYEEEN